MIFCDLHVHTHFCDGKDSPADIAERAYAMGFEALGFSGHAYTSFDESFCMSREATEEYIKSVLDLRERYRGRMDVLLGTERDCFGDADQNKYDYVIGSLHYVPTSDGLLSVDESREACDATVKKYFGGSYLEFARCYYRTLAEHFCKTRADIVGHFDLVCKFNEGDALFDTSSREYRCAALEALCAIIPQCRVFEVNMGAVARGYRKTPYPDAFLLSELRRRGCELILSSDAHTADGLGFGFANAEQLLLALGFDHVLVRRADGFKELALR